VSSGLTTAGADAAAHSPSRPLALVREHRYPLVVWAAMLGWSVAMFGIVRSDYLGYRLGRFDLGNMAHTVRNTAHGRLLETTNVSGEHVNRLASHVDPILALLAPLWLLAPSPLTLAAVQIAAVAAGALPVFWLARRHVGSERLAMVLALGYLLYPWVAWTALDAIHPVTLAIPLLLYATWFLDGDRLAPFAVCAVLALTTGELLGLTVFALGLWYAFSRGRIRPGLVIAGAGVGWTLLALLVVVPAFSGRSSGFYGFYDGVGGSPLGMVETAFTDPGAILGQIFERNVLLYVVALAAPLGGLFVLSPGLAAVGLPQAVLNALADPAGPIDPRQHYLAAIVPFLIAATVLGVARLRPEARGPAAGMVLFLSLAVSLIFGPWAGGRESAALWYQTNLTEAHIAALDRAVALVPDGAPASTSNRVGARLVDRRYLYVLPKVARADWVVLDTDDRWLPDDELPVLSERPAAELDALRRRLEEDASWVRVLAEDGVYVFRRA
jgi:uncharacterized membrane protein